jgi:hypothetical protein
MFSGDLGAWYRQVQRRRPSSSWTSRRASTARRRSAIRHAPDDGQEPHRLAAYGTEEVIVAEVHGGSVQAVVRPSVSTSVCGRERRRPSSGRPRIAPHGSLVCRAMRPRAPTGGWRFLLLGDMASKIIAILILRSDGRTPRRSATRANDRWALAASAHRSPTDHPLHLCKCLFAGDPVIGAICFTSASQGSHSRLHRQPHVNQLFLRC